MFSRIRDRFIGEEPDSVSHANHVRVFDFKYDCEDQVFKANLVGPGKEVVWDNISRIDLEIASSMVTGDIDGCETNIFFSEGHTGLATRQGDEILIEAGPMWRGY